MRNSVVLERLPAADRGHTATAAGVHKRQRVYIFLTRYGFIFSLTLLVMLLGAINYNNSLAYALTFLLAGLFMVSMLHTYSNLRGLIISVSPAEPVFAGQQACFPLLLDNRLGPSRHTIDLQLPAKLKPRLRKTDPLASISVNIPGRTLQAKNFYVDTTKRGYLVPGRIRISSNWPVGLFRAWSFMNIDQRCVVYPRPQGRAALPLQATAGEEEQTGQGSGSEDFTGFRQYQAGDSMRAVDWKAYARERGLLTKRFNGSGTSKILVDWQQTGYMSNIEQRLSQLCLWIIAAEQQGAQYALVLPGFAGSHFDKGETHKHRCLQALASYGVDNDSS